MKIFQIGFNKCGTRTIHDYLCENGVRSVHWDEGRLALRMFSNFANGNDLLAGYEHFDAFFDMEYLEGHTRYLEAYKLYPYLAAQYPKAVFNLNTRDREAWIRSRLRHWEGDYALNHRRRLNVYSDEQLAALWREDWERHHSRVTQFFAARSHRFLSAISNPICLDYSRSNYRNAGWSGVTTRSRGALNVLRSANWPDNRARVEI